MDFDSKRRCGGASTSTIASRKSTSPSETIALPARAPRSKAVFPGLIRVKLVNHFGNEAQRCFRSKCPKARHQLAEFRDELPFWKRKAIEGT